MSSQTKFNTAYVLIARSYSDLFKLFAAYNWSFNSSSSHEIK
jgi:hypothetical protein